MTCPNCGKEYEHDVRVCPVCDTPLSNAIYTPIISSQRKKRHWIIPVILLILLSAAIGGYYLYQNYTKEFRTYARAQSESVFEGLHSMDFSNTDPDCLPLSLRDHPDIKAKIRNAIYEEISQTSLSEIIDENEHPFDTDTMTEDILKHASYHIAKVSTELNQCTVTIEVSNLDYSVFIQSLAERVSSNLQTDETLWQSISQTVKNFFFGEHDHTEDIRKAAISILEEQYTQCLEDTPRNNYTSEITYTFTPNMKKKIYLHTFDDDLINHYYGINLFPVQ